MKEKKIYNCVFGMCMRVCVCVFFEVMKRIIFYLWRKRKKKRREKEKVVVLWEEKKEKR